MEEYIPPNIAIEDIEILVFSFDGVLYSAPSFEEEYFEFLVQTVTKLTINSWDEEAVRKKLIGYNVIYHDSYDREDIRDHMENDLGIMPNTYDRYRLTHYFWPQKTPIRAFSNEVLRELAKRFKLYIVTNDSMRILKSKAKQLGIDLSVFTNAYAPVKYNPDTFSYFSKYRQIINNHVLFGYELCALGTNYYAEVLPMLRNKGSALQVNPCDVEETEKYLLKHFLNK